MSLVVDIDSHIVEPRDMWAGHMAAKDRDKALTILTDELGYSWISVGQEQTSVFTFFTRQGDWKRGTISRQSERQRQGLPCDLRYDDMPEDHWNYRLRAENLRTWGIDHAVAFPQWTLQGGWIFRNDPAGYWANVEAWNRYAVEVARDTANRLLPAGMVRFEGDFSAAARELAALSAGGVRLALLPPGLINNKRLSHPDNERVWQLFIDNGITPFWHIATGDSVVAPQWSDDQTAGWYKVLENSFSRIQPQLCLADLAVHGTFAKFPQLSIGVIEYRPEWLPNLLFRIDNSYMMSRTHNGRELTPGLDMAPSAYIRRQVRFGVFPEDDPVSLSGRLESDDMLMYGGDYPHAEGYEDPLNTFESIAKARGSAIERQLYGASAAAILHLDDSPAAQR